MKQDASPQAPNDITGEMVRFYSDPLGFVYFSYDWGQASLAGETGPDGWQVEVLEEIRTSIEGGASVNDALMLAVKSGHGVGKSALIAWVIQWFLSTRPHPQAVVTANTKDQLEKKTWRELAKWHKLFVMGDAFEWTATKYYLKAHPETWFAAAIPWSAERSEAFAGTHDRHVLVIYDEASLIADVIWEVTEGAMTTDGAIWLAFGNPTRNTGRFRECWGKFRHRWKVITVDSRKAKKTNKVLIQQWADDYGDDSDFFRIRAKGEFPRAASNQFIESDIIEQAAGRVIHPSEYVFAPIVLSVDVARFGSNKTVFYVRQGLAILHRERHRGRDTMWTAGKAIELNNRFECDAIFIDDCGVGGGVTDRIKQLGYRVIPVNSGATATDDKKYFNKRAENWGLMRDWLRAGGCIPDDPELKEDMGGIEYGFDSKQRLQLEKKEDMEKRGLASPDDADALSLGFAQQVRKIDAREAMTASMRPREPYDPIGHFTRR